SIEIGVTTVNPESFTPETFPQSATELRVMKHGSCPAEQFCKMGKL
ncbi:unnamed protein product, partial [Allacma fusca]